MVPVHPGGDPEVQEVHRSKKSEKKIPEKLDFPDPDPEVVLRGRLGGRGLPVAKISDLYLQ